jgi:hypothetical protein
MTEKVFTLRSVEFVRPYGFEIVQRRHAACRITLVTSIQRPGFLF